MPIEKGQEWGSPGLLPVDAPLVSSDEQAAALIGMHPIIGVDGGDLARTLGIRKPYDRAAPKHLLPVDALEIELDSGASYMCIAHVVFGSPLLGRHVGAVMNAAFIGSRNIAPRAHPGDGKADVIELGLGPADRFKAWRRMATASHLPHPGIRVRRLAAGSIELGRPSSVRIDGRRVGRSASVRFTVVPNAIMIAVS